MIVVADTSVLLNLCCVEEEELLQQLFHEVIIPPEVGDEFHKLTANVPRFNRLSLPRWVRQRAPSNIPQTIAVATGLDPGECAALSLAIEIGADAILMDERRGYEVARQCGLKTIGLLGILIQAKAAGFLTELRPVIDRLEQDARFWIDKALRERVLQIAGE